MFFTGSTVLWIESSVSRVGPSVAKEKVSMSLALIRQRQCVDHSSQQPTTTPQPSPGEPHSGTSLDTVMNADKNISCIRYVLSNPYKITNNCRSGNK